MTITAQQAPSAIFLQPGLSLAFTTASTTNQLKPPSIKRYKRYKDSNVKIELLNEEKRLFFNQPTTPTVPGGGGKSG